MSGIPWLFSWNPRDSAQDLLNPRGDLMLTISRQRSGTGFDPIIVVPIGLDRVGSLEAHLVGSSQGVQSSLSMQGAAMVWRDVEEVAAFVQSWGDEYAPIADAIRERWAGKATVLPLDAQDAARAAADHVGQHEDCETCERAVAAMPAQIAELQKDRDNYRSLYEMVRQNRDECVSEAAALESRTTELRAALKEALDHWDGWVIANSFAKRPKPRSGELRKLVEP